MGTKGPSHATLRIRPPQAAAFAKLVKAIYLLGLLDETGSLRFLTLKENQNGSNQQNQTNKS
jgi:hypothetical protein